MYSVQEDHKVVETSVKYTCDFCGKAFLAEYYLDAHFERRHADRIQVVILEHTFFFSTDTVQWSSQLVVVPVLVHLYW